VAWIVEHDNGAYCDQPKDRRWTITATSLMEVERMSRYLAHKRGWTANGQQPAAQKTVVYHRAPENPPPIPSTQEIERRIAAAKRAAGVSS